MAQQQSTATVTLNTLRDGGIYRLNAEGRDAFLVFIVNSITDTDQDGIGFLYTLADFVNQDGVSYYVNADETIVSHTSARTVAMVADLAETGLPNSHVDSAETLADRVMLRLGINASQLNALYTAVPVDGYVGLEVEREVCERFGIDQRGDYNDGMANELERLSVLSAAEAEYLNDAE